MSILDLSSMSTTQKFMVLEELWEDMSKNVPSNQLTPNWHIDELSSREKKLKNNKSTFSNLEDAKSRLKAICA